MRRVLACGLWMGCGPADEPGLVEDPSDPAAHAAAVSDTRYETDLTALAVVRSPGSAGWQAAQDRCAEVFEAAGFTVERDDYGSGTNVIGRREGTDAKARTVVVSAHYDSVPNCRGADDNASGVAGVLEAARLLGEGTWSHDLVVACWDEEERGLVGSAAWADAAAARNERIRLAWSLEMIGYTNDAPGSQSLPTGFDLLFPDAADAVAANDDRGDFITFVGDERTTAALDGFRTHAGSLPVIEVVLSEDQVTNPLLGDLQRSDHASFWARDYPAVMVTDTSEFRYPGYHCREGRDNVSRLDLDFAVATTRAVVGATAEVLQPVTE